MRALFGAAGKNFQEGGFFRGQSGQGIGLAFFEYAALLLKQRHERAHGNELFRGRPGETACIRACTRWGMHHVDYRL